MSTTAHRPAGHHSITPSLSIKGCAAAMEFYKNAFGAVEVMRMASPDGTVMHAEMRFGDSLVMMSDEFPDWQCLSPQTLGGSSGALMFFVTDVDAVFAKAIAAGAKSLNPPADQFYGDRTGRLLDPYGHKWSIATHKEDLTPEEISQRAAAWMQQQ